jgi:hypothetical protein
MVDRMVCTSVHMNRNAHMIDDVRRSRVVGGRGGSDVDRTEAAYHSPARAPRPAAAHYCSLLGVRVLDDAQREVLMARERRRGCIDGLVRGGMAMGGSGARAAGVVTPTGSALPRWAAAVDGTARTFSGATKISCFLERIRKKVRSFCGSSVRTAERALEASDMM